MKVFFVVQESQLRDVLEWLKSLDQRVVSVTFLSFFFECHFELVALVTKVSSLSHHFVLR